MEETREVVRVIITYTKAGTWCRVTWQIEEKKQTSVGVLSEVVKGISTTLTRSTKKDVWQLAKNTSGYDTNVYGFRQVTKKDNLTLAEKVYLGNVLGRGGTGKRLQPYTTALLAKVTARVANRLSHKSEGAKTAKDLMPIYARLEVLDRPFLY